MTHRALLFAFLALGLLASRGLAGASPEEILWKGNKITPEQPFPASVRALSQSWTGYELLLEEINGERLCLVSIDLSSRLIYTIADAKDEAAAVEKRKQEHWIYLSPGIEVDRFNWAIGPWRIGRIFGEEDLARKVLQPKKQ